MSSYAQSIFIYDFDRNEMRIKLGNIRVGGMPNERKVLIYRIEIEKLNLFYANQDENIKKDKSGQF